MRSLYIFLFLFLAQGLFAQHTFQRIYEVPDRQMIHGGMAVSHDGGFYLVNIYQDVAEGFIKFHVTRHHLKGDVLWAYDYELEGYGMAIDIDMDIIETEDRGIVFGVTELEPLTGGVDVDLLVKLDSAGEILWSKLIDSEEENAFAIAGQLTLKPNYSEGVIIASLHSETPELGTNTYLASLDAEGETEWSMMYDILDEDGIGSGFSLVTAMDRCEVDTTFMISGILDTMIMDNEMFLSKVNPDGEMIWSRSYAHVLEGLGDGFNNQVFDIACANDTTTTVVGVLQDITTGQLMSYVFKVDSIGLPIWSNTVMLPGDFPIAVNAHIITDISNNVIISGRYLDVITGDAQDYMIRFNSLGDLIWNKQFPRVNSFVFDPNAGLLLGGDLHLNENEYQLSGISSNLEVGSVYPFVVRVDQDGSAVCEENVMAIVNDTLLTFTNDTLFWGNSDFGVYEDFMVDRDTFSDYDLPMVTLLDTFFCPQDPIMVTLDATAEFAETYSWSTGETTPMIEVTEDGEYMVTVTFDTLTCFSLCDTSIITQLEFPELAINGSNAIFCETGDFVLDANPSMGLPPFVYEWSTGETEEMILVDEFGDYSVTITDGCGNSATETINYNESNLPDIDPFPGLTFNQSLFCDTGDYVIGLFNAAGVTNIVWSTGETEVTSISVPGPGTYSVTGIVCEQAFALDIDEGDFGGDPISPNGMIDEDVFCVTETFPLSVSPTGGFEPYTYEWSTGETESMITVSEVGTYDVTISDSCNDAIIETFTVDGLPEPDQPMLSFDIDSFCISNMLIISLDNPQDGFFNAQWSNGVVNASEILVEEVQVYTFTAINCFQEVSASIDVAESFPSEGLQFPNVFFPSSMDTPINQTFGPHVECPALIEDYELRIYNRWGKLVFETDNVVGRWNGAIDGQQHPSDVFYWYARYTEPGGRDVTVEGDVSLVR